MTTRRQHYVWQHYLRGWQDNTGTVFCLREGNIFRTSTSNIMGERDFYKLPRFSSLDINFLEALISKSNKNSQSMHRSLLSSFTRVSEAYSSIQRLEAVPDDVKEYVKALVIELEERLHQVVEGEAVPILCQLRSKRLDFFNSMKSTISFFHYVSHQYMRTKKVHESIEIELRNGPLGHDFSHLTNFVCYFGAVNLGGSLYVDRDDFDFMFLENTTDDGFITGDQPLVNLLASRRATEPEDFIAYYPLNSRLSLLMSPKKFTPSSIHVTRHLVKYFNQCIAWQSRDSLVSDSVSDLETMRGDWLSQHPSFHDQFDVTC